MPWPSAGGFAEAFKKIEAAKGVDLKTDAGRWTARAELCAVIEPWVAAQTAAEVSAALKKAGALWAPYQTFRELAADKANVLDNPMFTVLDQPGIGRYPVAASPLQFGAVAAPAAARRAGAGPAYGRDPVGYPGPRRSRDRQAARREGRRWSKIRSSSPAAASRGLARRIARFGQCTVCQGP